MVDPHAFMDALREFHHNQGEDLKAPIFNRRVMDLKKLWELVYAHGGSHQVCLKKRWASIGRCFNPPPSMTNLSFHIKRIFERYLLPFEQLHFPERAMKTSTDQSSQSSSSCSSPVQKHAETISPAFDHPVYIPKKKRSKLTRKSRFGQNKNKVSKSEVNKPKKTLYNRTLNPNDFAMPQTLVRTSTALHVDDCEIQAASALQQMKGFPTLTNRLPPVINPPSFMNIGVDLSLPRPAATLSSLGLLDIPQQDAFETTNEIYLSNGIRVIPIKPTPDGFIPISIERPTPELRPTSLIPPSVPSIETTTGGSVEVKQSEEIERLRKQVQDMQSIIMRQESKIQAAETSFVECKQCFEAIVANMNPASASTSHLPAFLAPPASSSADNNNDQ